MYKRQLNIALAGHPPPLLVGSTGSSEIGGAGPVLGINTAEFSSRAATLSRGQSLILYTDGLTDARRPDPIQTRELVEVAERAQSSGAAAIGAALEEYAEAEASSSRRDDLAIVVVDADGGTSG